MKFNILLALTLFISIFSMDYIEFENLLDKDLSITKDFTGSDFRDSSFKGGIIEGKFYSSKDHTIKDFFGMPYNHITVLTTETDIVQSITIHFIGMIDRTFYDAFNGTYGEPNHIQIIENRQLESETFIRGENGKVIQHLAKNTFDLREGTFEEKPLWIVWEKEGYEIKA
ncbi:hypothetical protein ACFO3O_22375, partial [Dokdonia ponticola]